MGPSSSSQPSSLPPLLTQLPQPQPHTTLQLQHLIMLQLQLLIMPKLQSTTNPLHLPSNTELLMITQRLTSTPKKPQMARSPADLTKSTFPMAATKVSQYTQKLSHTTQPQPQLTDTQLSSRSTLKNLPQISSVQPL